MGTIIPERPVSLSAAGRPRRIVDGSAVFLVGGSDLWLFINFKAL
jgi:hypothetical protein